MDFKTATDQLAGCVTHDELAQALGQSVQSIRQARLDPEAAGYRTPPTAWRTALADLARRRGQELEQLAQEIESDDS